MTNFDRENNPHRRYNPLLDEWILVSPHRTQRPWQGQEETQTTSDNPEYIHDCYLCPDNKRANGKTNPNYTDCYVFENDFAALQSDLVSYNLKEEEENSFFKLKPERGISKVVCFSPKHNLTLPEMSVTAIAAIIQVWQKEYNTLGKEDFINYVQIFENKGSIMGCSNSHPHGQIWAQSSLPTLVEKTQKNLLGYYIKNNSNLLLDYIVQEIEVKKRLVIENNDFVVLVPFWAIWPYETMIVPKRHITKITDFTNEERESFASILKDLTTKYDNLFNTSFPYSAGIHQAPTDSVEHPEWQLHMHFYPPLIRSSTIKKFMVGYEMLGESQRDSTPEKSASILRELPIIHYKLNQH